MALIINLRSRLGPRAARMAPRELERQGARVRESHLVRHSRELTDAVRGVIARGAETVVVGGGDGTLSAVIDFFANYMPRDTRPTTLLRLVLGLWVTRQRLPSLLSCITGDSAIVVADSPQEIDVDGEFTQLTPAVFQLAREAVRILVPNSAEDDLR